MYRFLFISVQNYMEYMWRCTALYTAAQFNFRHPRGHETSRDENQPRFGFNNEAERNEPVTQTVHFSDKWKENESKLKVLQVVLK